MADEFTRIGPVSTPAPTPSDEFKRIPPGDPEFARIKESGFLENLGTGLWDKGLGLAQLATPAALAESGQADTIPETVEGQRQNAIAREERIDAGGGGGWGRPIGNVLGDLALTAPLVAVTGGGGLIPGALGGGMRGALAGAGRGALAGAEAGVVGGLAHPSTEEGFADVPGRVASSAATGAALSAPLGALAGSIATRSPEQAESFIRDTFNRVIKPNKGGKDSNVKIEGYEQKVFDAFDAIVRNKDNLKFTLDSGEEVAGKLPKTIEQFRSALDQTKSVIFQRYDAMSRAAGEKGVMVDLRPAVTELEKLATSPILLDNEPAVAKYASEWAARLQNRGSYSPMMTQESIQNLNAKLESFYKNPMRESATNPAIDSMVANKLREALDQTIEKSVGPGYQSFKDLYGSLRQVEKDVVNRSITLSRQEKGGGILGRIADIASAEEIVRGVLTGNLSSVGTGLGVKAFAETVKWLRSPNRAVSRMFKTAEKYGKDDEALTVPPGGPREPPTIDTGPQPPRPTEGALPPSSAGTPRPAGGTATPTRPPPVIRASPRPPSDFGQPLPPSRPGTPRPAGGTATAAPPAPPPVPPPPVIRTGPQPPRPAATGTSPPTGGASSLTGPVIGGGSVLPLAIALGLVSPEDLLAQTISQARY